MGTWVAETNIRGPQGEIGPPGPGVVFKGTVPDYGDLPPGPTDGDMYITEDDGHGWVWDGTVWVDAGQMQGSEGPIGPQGPQGNTGSTGSQGPAGPANTLAIGTVTTVTPGGAATSTITGTSPNQTLNLGIPSGLQGTQGIQGIQGVPGADGATVPPATVTPLMDGTGAVGTTTKYAREDHRHPTDTSRAASTHTHAQADVTNLVSDLALKAPLADPAFTGNASLTSTDAGAGAGPILELRRNSASPAVNDVIAQIPMTGQNAAATKKTYADIYGAIVDPTAGSEDGSLNFRVLVAGTQTSRLLLDAAGVTLTGDAKAPTPTAGDNDTSIATTAFVTTAVAAAGVVRMQTFTGSGTYTPHAKMVSCIVECMGGGGAGGGVGGAAGVVNIGGGGGGGGYARTCLTDAQVGASLAVTIGAGGTGVSNGAGNTGGTTSVGSSCSAAGGAGGGTVAAGSFPGGGGLPTVGDFRAYGQTGDGGSWSSTQNILCGGGGNSMFGGGGQSGLVSGGAAASAGQPGYGYGSGGGGGRASNHVSNAPGGAGAPGVVIVTEYCSG